KELGCWSCRRARGQLRECAIKNEWVYRDGQICWIKLCLGWDNVDWIFHAAIELLLLLLANQCQIIKSAHQRSSLKWTLRDQAERLDNLLDPTDNYLPARRESKNPWTQRRNPALDRIRNAGIDGINRIISPRLRKER